MPTPLDRTPDVFTSQTVVVVAEVIPTRCHYQRALSLRRPFPIELRSFGDWRRGGTRRWKLLADWHDGLDGLTVRLDLLMCRLKEKLKHFRILCKSITQFFAPACTNKIAKGIKNKTTSHALWVKYIQRSLNSTIIYLQGGIAEKRISVREWDEQSITVKYFGISVECCTSYRSTFKMHCNSLHVRTWQPPQIS